MLKWKATEGVRRLSLALGLLFAVPWSLLMGGTCISEYLQFKPAWKQATLKWERHYGDVALKHREVSLADSIRSLQGRLSWADSVMRRKGFGRIPSPRDLLYGYEAEIERPSLLAGIAALTKERADVIAYAAGSKKRPPRPTLGAFYKALVALALSPVVFGIPWGAVRSVAWIIEGFREREHST